MKQAHIIYSGTVQGVGFRYTSLQFAARLRLTGWVKNLPEGAVEILAEGPEEDIRQFCQDLENRFQGYIRDKQISFSPESGNFKEFRITH